MSLDTACLFNHQHLLDISSLSSQDITLILDKAEEHIVVNRRVNKKQSLLKGLTLINLFFENSTRTRTSFELAGKRMGADVINMSVSTSSVKKGETLIDTAMTLNAMHPDFIVVRHGESGAVQLLSQKVKCSVINGGDGAHEHPTQALLDALTIRRHKGTLSGLKVALCGDIRHSRVARSNIQLLKTMGAEVNLVAPPTLLPYKPEILGADAIYHDIVSGIKGCDIIMMLRLQIERMKGTFIPSIREYFHLYGLDYAKLANAKPDALVMHPGPINRGIELDTELADDINRSVILDQVEMGIAIRQAVLELLADYHNAQHQSQ
ncbi:MAG: aspartate carbamoyltransferase catalytic subunit [Rickettsiales bacterium]|nr:aspartate carbamoyltransferase catalytic subunit [Rickettsiales bacterium]